MLYLYIRYVNLLNKIKTFFSSKENVIFIVFLFLNLLMIPDYVQSFSWNPLDKVYQYHSLLLLVFIFFSIKTIFRGGIKTALYITREESYYLYLGLTTDKIIIYKVIELFIVKVGVGLLLFVLYYYFFPQVDFTSNLFLFVLLAIYYFFCETIMSLIYQSKNLKRYIKSLDKIISIVLIFIILLLIKKEYFAYLLSNFDPMVKLGNIIELFLIQNSIRLIGIIIVLTLISVKIILSIKDKYNLLKFGNFKSDLSELYRKGPINSSQPEVNRLSDQLYGSTNIANSFLQNYYKKGYGALIYKNLILLFQKRMIEHLLPFVDIYLVLLVFTYAQVNTIKTIALTYAIVSFSNRVNNFIFEDIKIKEYVLLLPLRVKDFKIAYLFLPTLFSCIFSFILMLFLGNILYLKLDTMILTLVLLLFLIINNNLLTQTQIFLRYLIHSKTYQIKIYYFILILFTYSCVHLLLKNNSIIMILIALVINIIFLSLLYKIYSSILNQFITCRNVSE